MCAAMNATAQTQVSGGIDVRSTSMTVCQAFVNTMGPVLMASRYEKNGVRVCGGVG